MRFVLGVCALMVACSSSVGGSDLPVTVRHTSAEGHVVEVKDDTPVDTAGVQVLDDLPVGLRKKYRATSSTTVDTTHWTVDTKPDFPTADDPHRYVGQVSISVDVTWRMSPPEGAEREAKRKEVLAEQLARAKAAAARRGGNAVILMHEDMVDDDAKRGVSWLADGKSCGGRCVRQTFVYNVLHLGGGEAPPAVSGKEALAALMPEGYQPTIEGQELAPELSLPLRRNRCYALGIAIDQPTTELAAPTTLRLAGLTVGKFLINGNLGTHTFKLDSAFSRAAVVELGCSPVTEKQVRKLTIPEGANTSSLRWSLFEKPLNATEAAREYCHQCSGDAHACGKITPEACKPLLECLSLRSVSVAQCRKAYPAGY